MMTDNITWYGLYDSDELISPSLLVYPDRVIKNTELMIKMASHPKRLRPHIKTHKMAEVIEIQMNLGIYKFKCATLAEAELLAICQAEDVLLAMQPVAIQIKRFCDLIENYPRTRFSTIVDSDFSFQNIKKEASRRNIKLELWLDINNGMNRTGIEPGELAQKLYKRLSADPEIILRGLHIYDGHIHTSDPVKRQVDCDADFAPVLEMKTELETDGYPVKKMVAGGTPTFPVHEKRENVELSPGTTLLWDEGYGSAYTDLKFIPAAVLFTRIVSKPGSNLLCFDLGHKSVASEMTLPRVRFLGNHEFEQVSQSEEHLIVRCPNAGQYNIGDAFYALPVHICPTVAKYPQVMTVKDHAIKGSWRVAARDHTLN
jgi:D-serine deaminase-like pyridoxal phosphate-dependent protein